MSTPTGEPMISADYESRERLIAWDVPRVAADTEAMKAALKEYIVRLMFEGYLWRHKLLELVRDAAVAAEGEFRAAPIIKESEAPF